MRLGSKMRMDLSQTPNNPLAVRAVAMAHLDADTRGFLRQLVQGTSFGADNETTAIGRWTWSILLMAMTDLCRLIAVGKIPREGPAKLCNEILSHFLVSD